ncbi:MAG TPA: SusC/RagA family TonB-linked outer membrane protein [Flavisolibacter sp.]|jgi:TonB-linked SusC/RagA family outer membrane protein|nr:SusC/RagA family TonB-linked outer membrane protein [Flavisolibacter sp.]
MIQLKNLFLLTLLLWGASIHAQNRLLKGKVLSEQSPVGGATVSVLGSTSSTATDETGNFSLQVPGGNITLVVSSVGYNPLSRDVQAGENDLVLNIGQKQSEMEQVVVTALGLTRRSRSIPYATQTVSPRTLTEVRDQNNILNSLQGKIAGALITQSSGGVGSGARIVLRGNRSIQGSNSALIVIDGVPVYSEVFNNMASSINPDDIESMTVLRGASAAALYGSQAGNGVLVITTKKGAKDKISVNFTSNVVRESAFSLPAVQNEYGQGSNGAIDGNSGSNWGAPLNGQSYINHLGEERSYIAHPDNIKDFFRTGWNYTNSISVSGGSEKAQTYLSYTNSNIKGTIPSNDLMRHVVNLRLSNQISKRFSTDAKITYLKQNIANIPRSGEGNTPMMDIIQISRNISTEDARRYQVVDIFGIPNRTPWPSTVTALYGNPYWIINNDRQEEDRDQILGFLSAKFKITNWLDVTGRANLDRTIYKRVTRTKLHTISYANTNGGNYVETDLTTTQQWYDVILNGRNDIGNDIQVNYSAGAIYQDVLMDGMTKNSGGLNKTNMFNLAYARNMTASPSYSRVQTQSVFGQLNLGYKNYLFFDGSIRNDWDSRLPAPHSYQYYSAGVSAIISDMVNLPVAMSFLKLGLNYAEVGNGGQFGVITENYTFTAGLSEGMLQRASTLPMKNLKPEIIRNLEANLEARFFRNRLGIELSLYKSNSFNQLLSITVPSASGYTAMYLNAGNIQNTGVELVLTGVPVNSGNFKWESNFNLGINRNKVISLAEGLNEVYLGSHMSWGARGMVKVGGSYGEMIGHRWARDEKGNFLVKANGTPMSTSEIGEAATVLGNFNPKAILGLTNNFTYKAFNLRVLVDGRVGGMVMSGTEQNMSHSGLTEATKFYRDGGWHLNGVDRQSSPVGTAINAQQFWQTVSGKRNANIGEIFAYDATNFRVRELSFGYSLPVQKLFGNNVVKGVTLSAVFRNLLWLYRGSSLFSIPGIGKRKMWYDPDVATGNGNNMGIDYGNYPSTRTAGVTLNVNF